MPKLDHCVTLAYLTYLAVSVTPLLRCTNDWSKDARG